jgi:uncharacterized membrane protein
MMLNRFVNKINTQFGNQAPLIGVIAVFAFILGGYLGYTIVREFGVNNEANPSSQIRPGN